MDEIIKGFLKDIKVGVKQSHENMTLYCLLAAREADVDFLTLDDALDRGALAITEMDEEGSVPELKVSNKSDQKILMLDGEELVGAKQNRVLNVTVLIAAQSETVIPVSCVEQGRWSYKTREFTSARRAMSADLKKKKSRSVQHNLRAAGSFASAQGMVWHEIDDKFERMAAAPSPTMAMSDLYESHEDLAGRYLKAFHPVENQIGMVVFIDGEIAGVELLDKFDTFRRTHKKLIHSYVMDALETAMLKDKPRGKPSKAIATKILESAASASVEKRKSVALGKDVRLESKVVVGAGLEFEGQVLQMSIFVNSEAERISRSGSLRKASHRARRIVD
jgi:hypothetical protein